MSLRRSTLRRRGMMVGFSAIGLALASQPGHRLWMLNSITIPEGVDDASVRRRLLADHSIEIGVGLGPLRGSTWRIGLMGESSRRANVLTFLSAFSEVLDREGFKVEQGAAVAAAEGVYRRSLPGG